MLKSSEDCWTPWLRNKATRGLRLLPRPSTPSPRSLRACWAGYLVRSLGAARNLPNFQRLNSGVTPLERVQ
jgi:hypothetical protein